MLGGGGDDLVRGGDDADSLSGSDDDDQVEGGPGDDLFGPETGRDTLRGGDGADAVAVSEGASGATLRISLDGTADDRTDGNANVQPDVEGVLGDVASGPFGAAPTPADLVLTGNAQANTLRGGTGDDLIDGLGGNDTLAGGAGDDGIQARDGAIDTVACGAGSDSAVVDLVDLVSGCEKVDAPAGPIAPLQPATGERPPRPAGVLSARVSPRRDRTRPYRFTTSGRLLLPPGVGAAQGCTGRVAVQIKTRAKTISSRRVRLGARCRYRSAVAFRVPRRLGTGRLTIRARFLGNAALRPVSARTRRVRAG